MDETIWRRCCFLGLEFFGLFLCSAHKMTGNLAKDAWLGVGGGGGAAAAWDGSPDPLITSEFRSGPPREEDAAPRGATTEINQ